MLAAMTDRSYPPYGAGDREQLLGWLAFHRATLTAKCYGLSDEQLRRRSVPPSTLSLLGLVRHMTEVERGWFPGFTGERLEPLYCTEDSPDGDFDDLDGIDVAEAFDAWHTECARSDQIIAGAALDDTEPGDKPYTLRWIVIHIIEEYARHNGHADLLRQSIDGATGV